MLTSTPVSLEGVALVRWRLHADGMSSDRLGVVEIASERTGVVSSAHNDLLTEAGCLDSSGAVATLIKGCDPAGSGGVEEIGDT